MSWTPEKVEKLKELWGKGSTASEIAQILGGVTRNAVIGKAHRLNLSGKIQTKKNSIKGTPRTIPLFSPKAREMTIKNKTAVTTGPKIV